MVITPNARFTSGMTVGSQPPLSRVGLATRLARVAGMDVAWVTDHFLSFFPQAIWDEELTWLADPDGTPHAYFDYQVLLGRLSAMSGGLRLGVGVTEPVRRHPVQLAQAFMTIAHLSKRAPILGIGAGESENTIPYGLDFSQPVSRLEDALAVIRRCFDARGPFDHDGPFFRLDGALMDLAAPPGRRPEVWVAAHGPRMLALTGRFGDGWYPTLPMTPAEYEAALGAIQSAARDAGRDPAAITPGYQHHAIVGRSQKAVRRIIDSKAVRFLTLLLPATVWSKHGAEHPFGDRFRGIVDFMPQRHAKPELDAAIARVPTELIAAESFVGTPRQVEDALAEYYDAGLRHLVLQPIGALASRRDAVYSVVSVLRIQRRLRARFAGRATTPG